MLTEQIAGRSRRTQREREARDTGIILVQAMDDAGVTVEQAAHAVGVAASRLSGYRTGDLDLKYREALKMPEPVRHALAQRLMRRERVGIVDHPTLLADTIRELGDVTREYAAALADGVVDAGETREILQHIREAEGELARLTAVLLDGEGA